MTTKKTLKTLEFFEVLQQISAFASNPLTELAINSIRPDHKNAEELMANSTTAYHLHRKCQSPEIQKLCNIIPFLQRAKKGGFLSISNILSCVNILLNARFFLQYFSNFEDDPFQELCKNLKPNREIENQILFKIKSETELDDNASPKLASIRRDIREKTSEIKQKLDVFSRNNAKYLQGVQTVKNGRIVLPVKVESRNFIDGIAHTISSSGGTVFVEPNFIIKINNEIANLYAEENKEIERILSELSQLIAKESDRFESSFHAVSKLDFLFTLSRYFTHHKHVPPTLNHENRIIIREGRHPLIPPNQAVPLNIEIGDNFNVLVITGPNTGGKTVALKTIALFCLLANSGIFPPSTLPCDLPVLTSVFADIGDEQSISQNLSTFSAHITNIISILKNFTADSLVVLDELCAGTDPDEGAALATAILSYIKEKGAICLASTHYSKLKLYGMTEPNVRNASCEFDVATLSPTYRIITGVPGASRAFAVATKLGLNSKIIETAKRELETADISFNFAIKRLNQKIRKLDKIIEKNSKLSEEIETLKNQADSSKIKYEKLLQNAENIAKKSAKQIIEKAKKQADEIIATLKKENLTSKDVIAAKTMINNALQPTVNLNIPDFNTNKLKPSKKNIKL